MNTDKHKTASFTARDRGYIDEIIKALTAFGEQNMISYHEEIEFLKRIRYMSNMIERHALSGDIIVSKLLIDCPKGTELYCPIFGCNMYLECVTDDGIIKVRKRYPNSPFIESFDSLGTYETGGECMIFPSKENRDWTKFNK